MTQTPKKVAQRGGGRKRWLVGAALLGIILLGSLPLIRGFGGQPGHTIIVRDFVGGAMVLVRAGCFIMGSDIGDDDERPAHRQCFDEPFWIGFSEVTNTDYGSEGNSSDDNHPRGGITWFEARDYCESRGARLPTEAEWEYAARGPDNSVFPWGNTFIAGNVVYQNNSDNQTAEVGSRRGGDSWVGATDMSGNVWEWTSTINLNYPYDSQDGRENPSDTTNPRVIRGGSLYMTAEGVRSAVRGESDPSYTSAVIGFRCARDFAPSDLEGAG